MNRVMFGLHMVSVFRGHYVKKMDGKVSFIVGSDVIEVCFS